MRQALGGPIRRRPRPRRRRDRRARDGRRARPGRHRERAVLRVRVRRRHAGRAAADWLTATWDQNAGLYATGPAAAVVEEVAGGWLLDLLGLPAAARRSASSPARRWPTSPALAAARHEVLRRRRLGRRAAGPDGAPPIRVVAGADRHDTIDRALRFLGLGTDAIAPVAGRRPGPDARRTRSPRARRRPARRSCARRSATSTPAPSTRSARSATWRHEAGAWVHVDGAFGLWAAASPALRPLVDGVERADSWATDAHKWLNVPYDSRAGLLRRPGRPPRRDGRPRRLPDPRATATSATRSTTTPSSPGGPAASPVYAALRALGRSGVADLVERCCALARRFAERLGAVDGVEVLNDVVLNQVLVRFDDRDDAHTAPDRRAGAARRHLLDERHDLAGAGRDADLGVELVDRRGRRRRQRPGDR